MKASKIAFISIIIILLIIIGISSCRKLPPEPDHSETLNTDTIGFPDTDTSEIPEITVPCSSELEDNHFFMDFELDDTYTTDFEITNFDYTEYEYYSIVQAEDNVNGVYLEIRVPANISFFTGIKTFPITPSNYNTSEDFNIKLINTNYFNRTYYPNEETVIYVEITDDTTIINICQLEFSTTQTSQEHYTVSGRIKYSK